VSALLLFDRSRQVIESRRTTCLATLVLALVAPVGAFADDKPAPDANSPVKAGKLDTADGYQGIRYAIGIKYSGGFATYPQQIRPFAVYAPAVDKTFFCYGGKVEGQRSIHHMLSWFDHKTGTVPRPRILMDNAKAGFYGFWADGSPDPSNKDDGSRLYFCDAEGNVFQLPEKMTSELQKPLNLPPRPPAEPPAGPRGLRKIK
jgi:hypothetical protein